MTTYTVNIPKPTDIPATSQGQMYNNFNALNNIFGNNHYQFTNADTTLQGKHAFCSFPQQSVDPPTLNNELALYTKSASSLVSLYLRAQNNGPVSLFQPSSSTVSPTYYSFLSNASFYVQGGSFNYVPTTGTILTFPNAFATNILGFFTNPNATNFTVFTVFTDSTQAVIGGANACTINWMAIGY
jgi:hypothetical protein